MKKGALIFLLCLLISSGFGCQKTSDSTVKVGLIAELTGDIPAVGASCKNSAELAAKEINDSGGITIAGKNYTVELFIQDSAAKPDQSAAAAQKLITQNNVIAIIGPNASSNAIPASEIAETSKTVLITPWSTNPKTTQDSRTGEPKNYVFRACFTDVFEGHILGKFAAGNLGVKRAAILFDVASEVLKSQSELFKNSFEKSGGTVAAYETYTTGDKDFSAQLTKIKNAAPQIVFLPSYYTDVPLQVQQAHRLGINVPFLGSDAWSTEELIKMCGSDCEGFYFCNHYSPDTKNPATRRFIETYTAKYGKTPDDVAALTYDAFGLLRQAIVNSGTLDRQAVRDSLAKIKEYKGVTGEMRFLPGSRDPIKGGVIMQIKNGKFSWFADVNP
jgi:branched-chain amino acid transport system substrate-binding protein